jgi:hypothetical protein
MSICWYSDDDLQIIFDKIPKLNIRFIHPWMNFEQVSDINKKPFICNEELKVILIDEIEQENYEFQIPEGYVWDGATIPRIFWRLIGSKTDNRFLIPSLIHDVRCENHEYVDNNRYFSCT